MCGTIFQEFKRGIPQVPAPRAWGIGTSWQYRDVAKSNGPKCPSCGTSVHENTFWRNTKNELGQVVGFDPENISDKEVVGRLFVECVNPNCQQVFWFGVCDDFYIFQIAKNKHNFKLYTGCDNYEEFIAKMNT